jgi:Zn-dependent membrane protease YugP
LEQFLWYFEVFGYLFVVIASVFAMITSANVNRTFQKYSRQMSSLGLTGEQAAKRVLNDNGVYDVMVSRTPGNLTDHYDPRSNTVFLSDSVFSSTSTAAIGVAAHEAGHAVQHAEQYAPIRLRTAIVPITNFGSRLATPMILIGLLLSGYIASSLGYYVALAGVFLFSFCVIFQLVTLPTEFNASARAMRALERGGILMDEELKGARKTLTAAAMTYVAALAVSLMQFLRLLAVVTGGRRRK